MGHPNSTTTERKIQLFYARKTLFGNCKISDLVSRSVVPFPMQTKQATMNGAEAMAEAIRANLAHIRLVCELATLQASLTVEPREFEEAKAKAIRANRIRSQV